MVLESEEEVVVVEAEAERCSGMRRNELFYCFFSPSLVLVENFNRGIKLLLIPVKPPGMKDWNFLSRKVVSNRDNMRFLQ